jgi:hypothetical protein
MRLMGVRKPQGPQFYECVYVFALRRVWKAVSKRERREGASTGQERESDK